MQETLPRIAVIGAGLGGLTLARILQTKGVRVSVYEREARTELRSQGGTLDIHTETGQYALRLAGLYEQFRSLASPEGEDCRILDKGGIVHFEDIAREDSAGDRPEIDRGTLRNLLLESLEHDTIQWSCNLKTIRSLDNGKHELAFEDGMTKEVDLVVGADGAWSRVRPILSDAKPSYSGVTFIEIRLSDVDNLHPAVSRTVGRGSMFALSDNKGLIAQRNSNSRIRTYIVLRVPMNWAADCGIPYDQPQQARARLLELFADWSTNLTNLISLCEDSFMVRPLYVLPSTHTWQSRDGVTLLGDAAHVMSPFAGEGANLAMMDAAELALAISGTDAGGLAKAISAYESRMMKRASASAEESLNNQNLFIDVDSPKGAVKRMSEVTSGGP